MKRILLLVVLIFTQYLLFAQTMMPVSYPYGNMPNAINNEDALEAYNRWKELFVESCPLNGEYRVKGYDISLSTSEGITYGMLLSVYAQDKEVFDGLTKYYNKFIGARGVMNFETEGCFDLSRNCDLSYCEGGLAEAEFNYSMALIVADNIWGSNGELDYSSLAKSMITTIKEKEINDNYVVNPFAETDGDLMTNPSFFTVSFFRVFGEYTDDQQYWGLVADKCYEILANIKTELNTSYGLVPDKVTSAGTFSSNALGFFQGGKTYYFDASRTPWRIALDYLWYGTEEAKDYISLCGQFADNQGGLENIVNGYRMDGTAFGTDNSIPFSGAFAISYMNDEAGQQKLDESYQYLLDQNPEGSFITTLYTLYMFTITGNLWKPIFDSDNCTKHTISSKIENENYCNMSGIEVEATTDIGGGSNIGYVDDHDWMSYKIQIEEEGTYKISYRVASLNGGNKFQLDMNYGQSVLGEIDVPSTAGWQNWNTLSHQVTLPEGEYEIGIKAITGGFNLNWFIIEPIVSEPSSSVSLDFEYDGIEEHCWIVTDDINYINSWTAEYVTINGVDITNTWVNSFPPKVNGEYEICFKGKEVWSHVEIIGENSNGRQQQTSELNEHTIVYPNPTFFSDVFVNHPKGVNEGELKVYDLEGRQVYESKITSNITVLKRKIFQSGVYILSIEYPTRTKENIRIIVD